jgi:hypothetical protein
MDQLWPALAPLVASTFAALVIRAHLLDIVVAGIRGWTWLVTLADPVESRTELRSTIAAHVDGQRAHYLSDLELGSAEAAIRLIEWQVASLPGDIGVVSRSLCHRIAGRLNWMRSLGRHTKGDGIQQSSSGAMHTATTIHIEDKIAAAVETVNLIGNLFPAVDGTRQPITIVYAAAHHSDRQLVQTLYERLQEGQSAAGDLATIIYDEAHRSHDIVLVDEAEFLRGSDDLT